MLDFIRSLFSQTPKPAPAPAYDFAAAYRRAFPRALKTHEAKAARRYEHLVAIIDRQGYVTPAMVASAFRLEHATAQQVLKMMIRVGALRKSSYGHYVKAR